MQNTLSRMSRLLFDYNTIAWVQPQPFTKVRAWSPGHAAALDVSAQRVHPAAGVSVGERRHTRFTSGVHGVELLLQLGHNLSERWAVARVLAPAPVFSHTTVSVLSHHRITN